MTLVGVTVGRHGFPFHGLQTNLFGSHGTLKRFMLSNTRPICIKVQPPLQSLESWQQHTHGQVQRGSDLQSAPTTSLPYVSCLTPSPPPHLPVSGLGQERPMGPQSVAGLCGARTAACTHFQGADTSGGGLPAESEAEGCVRGPDGPSGPQPGHAEDIAGEWDAGGCCWGGGGPHSCLPSLDPVPAAADDGEPGDRQGPGGHSILPIRPLIPGVQWGKFRTWP